MARFKQGQCGNPNGRPKKTYEEKQAQEFLKSKAMGAAKYLCDTFEDETVKTEIRFACAKEILDRACGKPRQAVENTNINIETENTVSLEESLRIIREMTNG